MRKLEVSRWKGLLTPEAFKKLERVAEIDRSENKSKACAKVGVPRATYYVWSRLAAESPARLEELTRGSRPSPKRLAAERVEEICRTAVAHPFRGCGYIAAHLPSGEAVSEPTVNKYLKEAALFTTEDRVAACERGEWWPPKMRMAFKKARRELLGNAEATLVSFPGPGLRLHVGVIELAGGARDGGGEASTKRIVFAIDVLSGRLLLEACPSTAKRKHVEVVVIALAKAYGRKPADRLNLRPVHDFLERKDVSATFFDRLCERLYAAEEDNPGQPIECQPGSQHHRDTFKILCQRVLPELDELAAVTNRKLRQKVAEIERLREDERTLEAKRQRKLGRRKRHLRAQT